MFKDRLLGLVSKLRHPHVGELYREYFARHAPGADAIDVGAMWRVNGAYAFAMLEAGARSVTALDVDPATDAFLAENERRRGAVRFVQADLMDEAALSRLHTFDLVFCAGVLYHLPDPLLGLERLKQLTRGRLLLSTRVIPEGLTAGRAVFFPYMSRTSRLVHRLGPGTGGRVGVDGEFQPAAGYANWFWGLSPSAVTGMLRAVGFHVDRVWHRPTGAIFDCSL